MEDLSRVGGVPAVLSLLLAGGYLHGDCLTVTGRTLAENLAEARDLAPGQEIIRPLEHPLKADGHLKILYGNLAPEGAVAKITGKEGDSFAGPAAVFDSEEEAIRALEQGMVAGGDGGGDPLRGSQRRAGDARDAEGHRGDHGRGAGRPDWP